MLNPKQMVLLMIIGGISLLTAFSVWALTPLFSSNHTTQSTAQLTTATEVNYSTAIDKNIPKNLYLCLPKAVQKLKLEETATYEQKKYFTVGIYTLPSNVAGMEEPSSYKETVVALDDIGCQVVVSVEKSGMASLLLYLPQQVAYDLALQRFRNAISKSGGKEKYQQILLESEQTSTPGDYPFFFPEDAWALNQLGIKLPANAKIVKRADELLESK